MITIVETAYSGTEPTSTTTCSFSLLVDMFYSICILLTAGQINNFLTSDFMPVATDSTVVSAAANRWFYRLSYPLQLVRDIQTVLTMQQYMVTEQVKGLLLVRNCQYCGCEWCNSRLWTHRRNRYNNLFSRCWLHIWNSKSCKLDTLSLMCTLSTASSILVVLVVLSK